MPEIKPGDKAYTIAENPIYDPVIRALKTSDPANADTVFNPLFSQIIENIHAVKVASDGKAMQPESTKISLPAVNWTGSAAPYQQILRINGIVNNNNEESLLLIALIEAENGVENFQVTATRLQTDGIVFSAEAKPDAEISFLMINMGVVKK